MSGCGAFKFAGSAIDPVYRHRNQTPAPSLGSRSQCALEHQAALGEPANMPAIGPHCGGGRYKLVRAKLEPPSRDLPVHCKVCKQPLAATDGDDIATTTRGSGSKP